MSKKLLALLAVGALVLVAAPAAASAQEATGSVRIVHDYALTKGNGQLPSLVCLNGEPVATGLVSGEEAGLFEVPTGEVTLNWLDEGAADCFDEGATIFADTFEVAADGELTVVAHDDDEGFLAVTVLDDAGLDCTPVGEGTLTIFHGSARFLIDNEDGAIDLDVDGNAEYDGLMNGEMAYIHLPAGPHDLTILSTGVGTTLVGPLTLDIEPGVVTEIYLNGGDDGGPPAYFELTRAAVPCEEPVTTTTTAAPTTTTTAAPDASPAQAVPASPRYTG